jgi:perosamine synthetase
LRRVLGSFGDISIFSLRKFLPLYDGGQLVINNPNLRANIPWDKNTFLFHLKVGKNILDKLIDASPSKIIKAISDFLRVPQSVGRSVLSLGRWRSTVFSVNNTGLDFDLRLANLRMSGFSRYILGNMNIPTILEKRRLNFLYLLKEVKSLSEVSAFFPDLPEGVCPWAFPVLSQGRRDFHLILRSKGIPTYSWSGVIHPELPIDKFPDAELL